MMESEIMMEIMMEREREIMMEIIIMEENTRKHCNCNVSTLVYIVMYNYDYTVHCTMYIIHCILNSVQYIILHYYGVHCILYSVQHNNVILYTVHCIVSYTITHTTYSTQYKAYTFHTETIKNTLK